MLSSLRFLIVSPTPTWPLDHGNRKRVHQIGSMLKERGHEVHFLHYPSEFDWGDYLPHDALRMMQSQWDTVHVVAPTKPMHTAATGDHHEIDEWWDPAIGNYLDWLFRLDRFDAVIVNYVWLSRALFHIPHGTLRIIDTHDRVGGRKELLQAQGLPPQFFYLTEQDEYRSLERSDLALAIKNEEATVFSTHCASSTEILSLPYVELPQGISHIPLVGRLVRFGLFGARNSLNHISTRRMLDELLHRAENAPLGYEIIIGGAMADDFKDIDHPEIRNIGRVAEMGDFYADCDCVVVPLTQSTGQKIRIGEALAFNMPIVSHAHAFEGYHPTHDFHCLPSVTAIADAMAAIAETPEILRDLHRASQESQLAQNQYVENAIAHIEAKTMAMLGETCLVCDDEMLKTDGPVQWRFTSVLRAAAAWGRAHIWLALSEVPDASGLKRIRAMSRWAKLHAPQALTDILSARCGVTISPAMDISECVAKIPPCQLWLRPGMDRPSGASRIIYDTDLDAASLPLQSSIPDDAATVVGSRIMAVTSQDKLRMRWTPFIIGPGASVEWRADCKLSPIWLIAPTASEATITLICESLGVWGEGRIRVWTNDASASHQFLKWQPINRIGLSQAIDQPELAVVIDAHTISDPLPFELLSLAGTPCIAAYCQHSGRSEPGEQIDLQALLLLLCAIGANQPGDRGYLPFDPITRSGASQKMWEALEQLAMEDVPTVQ